MRELTYCEFCGDQIAYLPFNCKYCGGTYCKKHRLPENHECTFEQKHIPVVSDTRTDYRSSYPETPLKQPTSRVYLDQGPKTLKKYLRRQEKQRERTLRTFQKPYRKASQYQGTKTLFIMILMFSIVALFFYYNYTPEYIYLSLNGLVYKFMFHTLLTSLFIYSGDILSLFFLFIILYFLYFMARNIEMSYGAKFLFKLYLIGCLVSAFFYILLRLSLIAIYPLTITAPVGLAWGGILSLLSFSIFPIMNRQITALMYFLPIRMRGRSFLLFIVLIRLVPALFYVFYSPILILFYLPELGGILGAYIVYRYKFGRL